MSKATAIVTRLLDSDAEADLRQMLPRIRSGEVDLGWGKIYRVRSRDGEIGIPTGGLRSCSMEGCGGRRFGVRWPDGKLTWICTKAIRMEGDTAVLE
jgi:hypothetical protein